MGVDAIVLAAGKGTRMKSTLPKVLHEVSGVPMVEHVRRAAVTAGADRVIVVVSPETETAIRELLEPLGVLFAVQSPPLGTGHAVLQALPLLQSEDVLVLCGDTPLLTGEMLRRTVGLRRSASADAVVATFEPTDASGYGRIAREGDAVSAIIEDADCSEEQRQSLTEVNSGVFCFRRESLASLLPEIAPNPKKGEIYLTDMVSAIHRNKGSVRALSGLREEEFLGVNDRWMLAEASRFMRISILRKLAESGVTIVDPASTYVGADVCCEPDVTILPMCTIDGSTTIGSGSEIGPNCWIKDATIGRNVRIFMSHMDQAIIGANSRCGPFSNLRPGAVLEAGVKIGNFVEIKNAILGEKTSVSHLTYLGDASVGARSNIGAGTITCNYDGYQKSRTTIGEGAFVGSNSTLVAPIQIGDGAFVAAGSVITQDVPDEALAVGRGRQENKEGWMTKWRLRKQAESEEAGT
ncbi:MAG: bifunctional UDP-N-acetylglucosamine diphosphorylase/glucosamine-1-phosphate N-acetyltransferase GlmU [Fimbriimonadaceae bacterium]|nr:bifunctional UDP-N-acetylglucosamine diphosphorylase/glucosamine-1-phosphate N-acetyltransferase GlmU [Fimbriimonadaceae bacterium]